MHSCAHVKTYMMLYHLHLYFTGRQCITNGDEICRKLTSATTVYKIRAYIHEYVLYVYHKCTKCYCENVVSAFCKTFSLDFWTIEWQKSPRKYNQFYAIKWSFCMPGNSYTFFEGNFSSCRQFFRNIFFFFTFFSKSQRCLLLSCFWT